MFKALTLAYMLLLPKKKKPTVLKNEILIKCPVCLGMKPDITEQGLCERCGNKIL